MYNNYKSIYCIFTVRKLEIKSEQWDAQTYKRLVGLIALIRTPTAGRITKALVVKGQILPEDVSSANVKQS